MKYEPVFATKRFGVDKRIEELGKRAMGPSLHELSKHYEKRMKEEGLKEHQRPYWGEKEK